MAFWRARWELCPWGEQAHWNRHAIDRADLINMHRDKKKKRIPYHPTEFLPTHNLD